MAVEDAFVRIAEIGLLRPAGSTGSQVARFVAMRSQVRDTTASIQLAAKSPAWNGLACERRLVAARTRSGSNPLAAARALRRGMAAGVAKGGLTLDFRADRMGLSRSDSGAVKEGYSHGRSVPIG